MLPAVRVPSIEDSIRRIRNRLRKYSARSIVDAALRELWMDRGSEIENLRAAPWICMLLAKWALADPMVYINIGPEVPQAEFDRIRQVVWDLPHREEGSISPEGVMALVRPILQQQIEFQRAHGWGFVRWPALIARRPVTDAIFQRFREAVGMNPDTYIDLAWALYACVLEGKPNIPDRFFAPLRPRYGPAVDQMIGLFTRDLAALRTELGKPDAQNVRGRAELREFAYLRRFPFVRLSPSAITCWHPAVLARGIEDAVHLRLSDFGAEYTRPFSRLFEEYVTELALEAAPEAVTEEAYMDALDPQQSKVEVLIQEPECNVLVEAKMALFADSVLVTDYPEAIYQKTKRVFGAIEQGWKVTAGLADAANPFHRDSVQENYLLVVTSRQLHVCTGTHLAELYPAGRLAYPNAESESRLSLRHIFILSIEDFERAVTCVRAGTVTFQQMLRKAVSDNAEPLSAKLYFSHHLDQYRGPRPKPALIAGAIEASRARLDLGLPED